MIDNFSLALMHGLMALAVWRLLARPDLDREEGGGAPHDPLRPPPGGAGGRGDA